ncbi:hypothetical protein [Paucibacter sp. XJ19-41]|uniref:hypothetical protein n=1 Tax=Paucibacter sp. XJ19-41 TaxID=2927824 RepID=UPI002349007C|nr:hypothetical protein [Paucibacter sp. XJ19-41]MDC6167441.1 hypothetical protein [Paucibacter sp. XJ19-41]
MDTIATDTFSAKTLRLCALAGAASALSTLALILLPEQFPAVETMADRAARAASPLYRAYLLIYLVHPLLCLAAALAVAQQVRRQAPQLAGLALLGFAAWASAEFLQQCLSWVANIGLANAWSAPDASGRDTWTQLWPSYRLVWDALYLFLLYGFMLGNTAMALGLARGGAVQHWFGLAFGGAALLTLGLLSGEFGYPLPAGMFDWAYLVWQPAARLAVALWLWRLAARATPALSDGDAATRGAAAGV